MKKIVTLLALITVATQVFGQVEGSVATEKELVEDVVKKNFEISTTVYGLFLSIYTVSFELSLADGLFGIGSKVVYTYPNFITRPFVNIITLGTGRIGGIRGIDALGVIRFYPALYRRGFYVAVQIGYTVWGTEDTPWSKKLASIPMMAGVGFKWVINQFSLDLGTAYGRRIYTSVPTGNPDYLNTFPFNVAFDGYFLFGFRF